MSNPYIIGFSDGSESLAEEVAKLWDIGYVLPSHIGESSSVAKALQGAFVSHRPIVAIGAVAIVVRILSPLLRDKHVESPVVVISERGRHVICVLGGHHGGNALADFVASGIGGVSVVSNAGIGEARILGEALENPPEGWGFSGDVKGLLKKLGSGERLRVYDSYGFSYLPPDLVDMCEDIGSADIIISDMISDSGVFQLYPPILSLGIGCERYMDARELCDGVLGFLGERGLSVESVACLATLDIKADEPSLAELSSCMGVDLRLFTAESLGEYDDRLANPSQVVMDEVGCLGVAEASCLAVFGGEADFVVEKVKFSGFTLAIARSRRLFEEHESGGSGGLGGQRVGHLDIVGLGPGGEEFRTFSAHLALANAEVVVGYGLYLDLCGDIIAGKERIAFDLGEERLRAEKALELASSGLRVSLVCSGDAGIYALASVVYDSLARSDNRMVRAVDICIHSGISAFQLLSARSGALFGDDFCLISLSDLQTPSDVIEKRICSAIAGDFAIAFYNPQSQRRRHLLRYAFERLLEERGGDVPVVIGREVGRAGERIAVVSLGDFDCDRIDMLTLVMVGNSQSRCLDLKGEVKVYTPRVRDSREDKA